VIIGPASLDAPDSVAADTVFYVNWIGPNNTGDYVTIMLASKRKWNGESYFYTYVGTPRQLLSPTTPGAYELRYIDGASRKVKARRPITVTAFVGSLSGPDSVAAGTEFSVDWTGPGSPGDYVTIEPVGATTWAGESYFYAYSGSHPGRLTAPLTGGPHELWYVAGDKTVMLRKPITVTPLVASVSGPATVNHGASFTVSWTGPDATGDFVTIVAAGAPAGTYLSYAYTRYGNPSTLIASVTPGQYELRYVYGAHRETLATATIQVN
jgi:Ca-activated chloride channel family protein